MSDLISRQQAIDELADIHCKSDEDGYVWIIRSDAWARIDALPSVQPEKRTEERTKTHACDLISRQEAIEVLAKFVPYAICDASTESYTNGLTDAYNLICQLPSAQPEPHYDEWCDDCKEYDKERHCCPRWNRVIRRALKDAQPERKTGRWIYGEDNPGTGRDGWFCSECEHFEMWDYSADMKSAELNLPNFCPNCGARMTEEDV